MADSESADRSMDNTTREKGNALFYRIGEWAVLIIALALILWKSHAVMGGDSVFSRLATVWSLTHYGCFDIGPDPGREPNPFEPLTVDKVEVDGKRFSSKPPVLPLLMAAEYTLLEPVTGWRLENRNDLRSLLRFMTVTLIVVPFAVALILFSRLLRRLPLTPAQRLIPLFGLAFACQVPGFATQFNNHVPAASCIVIALYFAVTIFEQPQDCRPAAWRFVAFGFFSAFIFTLDMPAAIFPALMGLALIWRYPREALLLAGSGAAPVLFLHFGAMLAATGSPLPVQLNRDYYLFESSRWRNPMGNDALNEPKSTYFFHMTFGRHGVFLLFPILLLAVPAVIDALFNRAAPRRGWILGGLAAFVILTGYYVFKTDNYGGAAYGFRWYIASMPILLLMGAIPLRRLRSGWPLFVIVLLLAVSMFSAWECFQQPWSENREWTCRWIYGNPW